jgi:16S rRNA (cytosine967-C5)-methyltransferase
VEGLHVAAVETLARAVVDTAEAAERAVFDEHRRADRAIAFALRPRRDLAAPDHRFVAQAVFALFRWHGWVEPLRFARVEERLLLSWLLDATTVHPVCRHWARMLGHDPGRLVALGDAPNWTARAEGLKRWLGGRAVNADPWRLFPGWLRERLPLPPGPAPPKMRFLEFLNALQKRPALWVRAQGVEGAAVWDELRGGGLNPWVHRRMTDAAKLDPDADVHHLPPFEQGELEIQDLASQAVGLVCDPDPGERWWDACAGAGGKALHLASLMGGKGVVVATDAHEARLKETVRRARRSPFRNVTTKPWDGKHVAGKPRSFDGVVVDAPCSAIGTWRRNPDARWSLDPGAVDRLAETQLSLLRAASAGVKPGGSLVYSVCTVTPAETSAVVRQFLEAQPEFRLDPFAHPLNGSETDGTLLIWPQEADSDAMYIARMVRTPGA